MNENYNKVLVIAAHPDDEILGSGGTIALHTAKGDRVTILILAEGLTSRGLERNLEFWDAELKKLQNTARKAAEVVGVTDVRFGGLPDNRMDSINLLDVVKIIESVIDEIQPNIIYTHHYGDLNIDHQITHQAVMTAARPLPNSPVKQILFFEVPSATGWSAPTQKIFIPQYYVDTSQVLSCGKTALERKIKALEIYSSEMRAYPHARSLKAIESLSILRGVMVGLKSAEAFQIGRIVQ